MNFNKHYNLQGLHAPFGASKSSWLRYTDDKLIETYVNMKAAEMGTRLHEFAAEAIQLGISLPKKHKTLNMYINDAIGFGMTPEQVLYYSDLFFGTADAIDFRNNFLRIHDLKTGKGMVHREQLEIYAALFCLEYKVKPGEIKYELRIYQNDEVDIWKPTGDHISTIMDKIITFNKILSNYREES